MAEDTFLAKLQAGLLGRQSNPGGMLADDDLKAARQQALMTMGAQLLQAGGPSSQPIGLGQALGGAMMAGRQAQSASTDGALQSLLLKAQIEKAQQVSTRANKPLAVMRDGKPVYVNQEEAVGMEPYSPMQRSEAPAVIQEYNLYSEQAKLAGQTPKPYMDWLGERAKTNVGAPFQVIDLLGGRAVANRTNPADIRQLSTAEQEAAGAGTIASATASGKVAGETQATAIADLPRVVDNAEQALKTINDFEAHPGFGQVFGAESYIPTVRGTAKAGALAYYKQIKGKTFLEAFNSLKGGGQITEIEGQKAEDAIARLDEAQSDEDAQKALDDLRAVIDAGVARAKKKAAGGASTGAEDPLGIRK
jgi:hypothetical protein